MINRATYFKQLSTKKSLSAEDAKQVIRFIKEKDPKKLKEQLHGISCIKIEIVGALSYLFKDYLGESHQLYLKAEPVEYLAQHLEDADTLTEFEIMDSEVKEHHGQALLSALAKHSSLTILHINKCTIDPNTLSVLLSTTTKINSFFLTEMGFTDKDMQIISEGFQKNRSFLDVSFNLKGDISPLIASLKNHPQLEYFSANCDVSEQHAMSMATVINESSKLLTVSLTMSASSGHYDYPKNVFLAGSIFTDLLKSIKTKKNMTNLFVNINVSAWRTCIEKTEDIEKSAQEFLSNNYAIIDCNLTFSFEYCYTEGSFKESRKMYTRTSSCSLNNENRYILRNKALAAKFVYASSSGDVGALSDLLKRGVSINAYDAVFNTALHEAMLAKNPTVVKFLISQGINTQIRNADGKTAEEYSGTLISNMLSQPEKPVKKINREVLVVPPSATKKNEEAKAEHPNITSSYRINYNELQFEKDSKTGNNKKLGGGEFGIVYKAQYRGSEVAVKELRHQELSGDALHELRKEAQTMAKLHSPYIVRLTGYCEETSHYCLVMEYMANGSLFDVLHNGQQFDWIVRYKIAINIAQSIVFLHASEIIHCDIKSRNVLLDNHMEPKMTDFGLSKVRGESRHSLSSGNPVGTLAWMAPELLTNAPHTKKSDIYGLGRTFFELATRAIPFEKLNPMALLNKIAKGEHEAIPTDCPKKFASLITRCLDSTPENRPEASEIVSFLKASEVEDLKGLLPPVTPQANTINSDTKPPATSNTMVLNAVENLKGLLQQKVAVDRATDQRTERDLDDLKNGLQRLDDKTTQAVIDRGEQKDTPVATASAAPLPHPNSFFAGSASVSSASPVKTSVVQQTKGGFVA